MVVFDSVDVLLCIVAVQLQTSAPTTGIVEVLKSLTKKVLFSYVGEVYISRSLGEGQGHTSKNSMSLCTVYVVL